MRIPKNTTADGSARNGLSLFLALGSLAVGLLAGILRDGFRRLRLVERPEFSRGKVSKPSMKTLYEKP